ncbi:MAG TPA: hypothetical protein PK950_00865 [Candidatus Paceibacterota bacterium]|nr:hypothetical protein [Candidatus Paceibacterota bacterium]
MKYVFLSIALLGICSMVVAKDTFAAPLTMPFGGKVITSTVPGITCLPPGTGPVVTSQTISGLAASTIFGLSSNLSGGVRVAGVAAGIYSSIPIYTTNINKIPKPGGYILGRHLAVPTFQNCVIGEFPFPTMQTTIYGVSK